MSTNLAVFLIDMEIYISSTSSCSRQLLLSSAGENSESSVELFHRYGRMAEEKFIRAPRSLVPLRLSIVMLVGPKDDYPSSLGVS